MNSFPAWDPVTPLATIEAETTNSPAALVVMRGPSGAVVAGCASSVLAVSSGSVVRIPETSHATAATTLVVGTTLIVVAPGFEFFAYQSSTASSGFALVARAAGTGASTDPLASLPLASSTVGANAMRPQPTRNTTSHRRTTPSLSQDQPASVER